MGSVNNPKRTTCNKVRFDSKELADENIPVVMVLNESKGRKEKNKNLHSYKCPSCNRWHVGHNRY